MRADVQQPSLIPDTGLGAFPRVLRNIKGEGRGGEQSEMGVTCMSEISPQASVPNINTDPGWAALLTLLWFPFLPAPC